MASAEVVRRARIRAGHRVAFWAHFVAWAGTTLLLAVVALPAAIIVALAWGIGLSIHGFFVLAAPVLRERWIGQELERVVPEVRTRERRATEAENARGVERLAASLAHEIRNPIAAAKSLVQQVAEDPGAPEVPEYARVAAAELDRVETSIAHLLRFAREEPLRLAPVALRDVVDGALDATRERTAGLRVDASVADASLEADADMLRRAVVNLVSNAADAVRAHAASGREPALEVDAGTSLDGSSAWVRVRDNGPGIDAAMRARVFDPWVTGKDAGTGLGLPIARKLCEAHGGTLEIERTGPEGTSMLITVPRDVASREAGA